MPDPASCNTCTCEDGALTRCTELNCPTECPDGFVLGTSCSEFGPADECLRVFTGCLQTCEEDADCGSPGRHCDDGICRALGA